ncbi:hypothetical protein MWH28_03805 [Natroniella sulfidigena]|uniref:hypothetical protein n=1 Tax=Natroniella sulfidigena TaxID=723921 RepID=UPI00200AC923|nr:hypothetical protein [Natroniella sulfidigena]MCK8816491.1 hypothetical protein [Natroniella sulfidigena]
MAKQQTRRGGKWLDPNNVSGRRAERYCAICGAEATEVRILKHENICEDCVKRLREEKDGKYACKACGKIAPKQLEENNGYCKECVCKICGKPDPEFARKHDFCEACFELIGTDCRRCGKEARAQVKRNDGLCDECADR